MFAWNKRRIWKKCICLWLLGVQLISTCLVLVYHETVTSRNSDVEREGRLIEHPMFREWSATRKLFCNGQFVGYGRAFALLKGVLVERDLFVGRNRGGEDLWSVVNQSEADEYLRCRYGAFRLPCARPPSYYFDARSHLSRWVAALDGRGRGGRDNGTALVNSRLTIAVQRYEYVNVYHTMTDWYNAFLLREFFRRTSPSDPDILLVDAHPAGCLDGAWSVLFHAARRLKDLPPLARFSRLVWAVRGYDSPLSQFGAAELPLADEFRSFFLRRFAVADGHRLDCARLSVLFLWRHDYVTHPRNPSGRVVRKIANERQLLEHARAALPGHRVRGVQMDKLSMKDQLSLAASVDVLVGMHGAGLTHALFLPRVAALVELFPRPDTLEHFVSIARWRNLVYGSWVDENEEYLVDGGRATDVPPQQLQSVLDEVIQKLCPRHSALQFTERH